MPLATRHRDEPYPALAPLEGLEVHHVWDAAFMATLQGRAETEIAARMEAGHRAYVAWLHEAPAAWGWVATREAYIGELGVTLRLRGGERYLWNFVTLPSHRGLGIYPRLLQAILRTESVDAERFWIGYAPENHASGAGIRKAGFVDAVELSFDTSGRPALRPLVADASAVASMLGLPVTTESLAPCWRCVRAGRGSMSCGGRCACDYQVAESGCAKPSATVPAASPVALLVRA